LKDCGHIPQQEITNEFVEIIGDIIGRKLLAFEQSDARLRNAEEDEKAQGNENGDVHNILNLGKEKIKQMMRNIHIIPGMHGNQKKNEQGLIQNDVVEKKEVIKVNVNVTGHGNMNRSQVKATENSALLPD